MDSDSGREGTSGVGQTKKKKISSVLQGGMGESSSIYWLAIKKSKR